jgi:hypothetical protein
MRCGYLAICGLLGVITFLGCARTVEQPVQKKMIILEDNFLEDIGVELGNARGQVKGDESTPGKGGPFIGDPNEPPDDIPFGDDPGPTGGQSRKPKHGEGK